MNYFEKILELQREAPKPALITIRSENSDYNLYSADLKNCYLLIGSERDEDCHYGNWIYESRDCTDCGFVYKSELLYECIDCDNCYNCNLCQDCSGCQDCSRSLDCRNCKYCFGCIGLRNKQYYILNKPYSKEEFEKKVFDIHREISAQGNDANFYKEFEELKTTVPRLYCNNQKNENCTGNYLYNSKNSFHCFDCKKLEDCMYMTSCIDNKDCMEMSNSYFGCELSYEVMSSLELYNCNFCNFCYYCTNVEYSEWCYSCKDCFGCFSLNKKQYYIFNESYSKEEYFKKVAQIKDTMRRDRTYGKHMPSAINFEDSAVLNYFPA